MSAISAPVSLGTRIARHAGATVTAVALALVSVVPVASALQSTPASSASSIVDWQPIGWGGALALALITVTIAALAGGFLGGLTRESHPVTGALVAMAVSWPVGITVLPIAAAALGIQYRAAIYCIDSCSAVLRSDQVGSGLDGYIQALLMGGAFIAPLVIALILFFVARIATRRRAPIVGVVLAVLGYGALHAWSVLMTEGTVPFLCLALGVVAWTLWLQTRDEMGFPA